MSRIDTFRKTGNRSGAALIELILCTLMLIGFLIFTMFFGRVLAERNRMLAANRTVAWLATHYDPGKEEPDNPIKSWLSAGVKPQDGYFPYTDQQRELAFSRWLRKWHFKSSGPAAGIVRVNHHPRTSWQSGLFFYNPNAMNVIKDQASGAKDVMNNAETEHDMKDIYTEGEGNDDDYEERTAAEDIGDVVTYMMNGFLSFLGGEFWHYHAQVEYGTPMLLPMKAYEFFFGARAAEDMTDEINRGMARKGKTYAFLKPATRHGCVMPLMDSGHDGSLAEMKEKAAEMLQSAIDVMKKEETELFRPHYMGKDVSHPDDPCYPYFDGNDSIEKAKMRLYGTLIYEYYDTCEMSPFYAFWEWGSDYVVQAAARGIADKNWPAECDLGDKVKKSKAMGCYADNISYP